MTPTRHKAHTFAPSRSKSLNKLISQDDFMIEVCHNLLFGFRGAIIMIISSLSPTNNMQTNSEMKQKRKKNYLFRRQCESLRFVSFRFGSPTHNTHAQQKIDI